MPKAPRRKQPAKRRRTTRWAVVIPRDGKTLSVLSDVSGKLAWSRTKIAAQESARWMAGAVVVDADLLANPSTRDQCLRDAGLGKYVRKPAARR